MDLSPVYVIKYATSLYVLRNAYPVLYVFFFPSYVFMVYAYFINLLNVPTGDESSLLLDIFHCSLS